MQLLISLIDNIVYVWVAIESSVLAQAFPEFVSKLAACRLQQMLSQLCGMSQLVCGEGCLCQVCHSVCIW